MQKKREEIAKAMSDGLETTPKSLYLEIEDIKKSISRICITNIILGIAVALLGVCSIIHQKLMHG